MCFLKTLFTWISWPILRYTLLSRLTKGWLSLFCPLCFQMEKHKGTDMLTIKYIQSRKKKYKW